MCCRGIQLVGRKGCTATYGGAYLARAGLNFTTACILLRT